MADLLPLSFFLRTDYEFICRLLALGSLALYLSCWKITKKKIAMILS